MVLVNNFSKIRLNSQSTGLIDITGNVRLVDRNSARINSRADRVIRETMSRKYFDISQTLRPTHTFISAQIATVLHTRILEEITQARTSRGL